jgi:hypothetical protein
MRSRMRTTMLCAAVGVLTGAGIFGGRFAGDREAFLEREAAAVSGLEQRTDAEWQAPAWTPSPDTPLPAGAAASARPPRAGPLDELRLPAHGGLELNRALDRHALPGAAGFGTKPATDRSQSIETSAPAGAALRHEPASEPSPSSEAFEHADDLADDDANAGMGTGLGGDAHSIDSAESLPGSDAVME